MGAASVFQDFPSFFHQGTSKTKNMERSIMHAQTGQPKSIRHASHCGSVGALASPAALPRLRPLAAALLGFGFQCLLLAAAPAHAGPVNAVPAAPTPVITSTTQHAALTGAANCSGQYTNAINAATNTALGLDMAGLVAQTVALTADGIGLALEIAGASTLISAAAVPGIIAQGVAVAANVVALGTSTAAVAASTAGAVLSQQAALLPSCDTQFNGTVQVNQGGAIITGNSHINGTLGVVTDINVGAKVQATRVVATDNTSTDTLNATGLSTLNGIANAGNIASTTLGTTAGATIGSTLAVGTNATVGGTLGVTGQSATNGITNTGNIATTTLGTTAGATIGSTLAVGTNATVGGTLGVTGLTTTNGIVNTGNIATTTLGVTGLTTTNGITNTGNITTTTLATTAGATIGSTLAVGTNATIGGTLGVTGQSTTNGVTNTGNIATTTLGTTAGATIGSTLAVGTNATIGGTLGVTGQSTTNGVTNTGNIATTTLGTTAGATIGSTLAVGTNATVGGTMNVTGTFTAAGGAFVTAATGTNLTSGANSIIVDGAGARMVNGANQVAVNANGVAVAGNNARVTLNGATASMLNDTNHGVVVSATQTLISGGTSTTNLLLNDAGASFSNTQTGGPARVTGIADGTMPFDAVNFRQLQALDRRLSLGISSTVAMANIPPLEQNKTFSVGVGMGVFNGATTLAIGGNYRMSPNAVFRASLGFAGERRNTFGAGASLSW